jgi:nucleoside-diphosphate-sugar epimerase
MAQRHILLTGGAGYIGSHTYLALVDAGHRVTILDNFSNARHSVIDRLGRITGGSVEVIDADVRDAGRSMPPSLPAASTPSCISPRSRPCPKASRNRSTIST